MGSVVFREISLAWVFLYLARITSLVLYRAVAPLPMMMDVCSLDWLACQGRLTYQFMFVLLDNPS